MPLFGQMTGIVELEKIFCIVIVGIIIQFESVEAKKKKTKIFLNQKKVDEQWMHCFQALNDLVMNV